MNNTQTSERLLTAAEVAEQFGRTEVALAKMRMAGTGPRFVRIGRAIRYRASDIDAYIEQQTFEHTSGTGR